MSFAVTSYSSREHNPFNFRGLQFPLVPGPLTRVGETMNSEDGYGAISHLPAGHVNTSFIAEDCLAAAQVKHPAFPHSPQGSDIRHTHSLSQ